MIAYILINADNSGTQPGSRSYERSWIRDGALTCSALLRAGLRQEITDYIKWFSQNLFPNGKVPCVVDRRGPDPVPENDGEGEYLFLLRQYLLFTHDTALIREKYPTVLSVVHYIKSLISERSTDYYKNGNDSLRSLYGLVPESISHEGYSAKPMHSYWDDFFTLRGLNDAAGLAHALGQSSDAQEFRLIASEFETNLYNSINATIKRTGISYIPGCADLGDYDATSTAISLYPCGQKEKLPQPYGKNTFDQYYDYFMKRRDHKIEWVNYTPYEVRLIGTFVQLGERERALDLVNFFMKDQKPVNWNQWAEVVWANDKYPGFIGDMPHTWVGSDYMTSFRMMFLYENEQDSSVVLMAGIPAEWLNTKEGVGVTKAPTYYGQLTYHAYRVSNCLHMKISGDIRVPGGGLVLDLPKTEEIIRKVFINKKIIESGPSGKIRVFQVPSTIEINYK
jgi:hypothetical protein